MASSLEQQLISGGLSANAAKAIANAIGNLSTAQSKASTQLVDGTPVDKLRMIGPEDRRSYFTNLDQPADKRFADRLDANVQGFEDRKTKHSYDEAEPRTTTSRINKASVVGGDFINVETSVDSEVQQSKVELDVQGSGRHLRLNPSRDHIEAVDFVAANDTEARISNEWVERSGATVLQSKVRGLSEQDVVLADGTAMPCSGWFNTTPPLEQIFSAWVKNNVLDAGNRLDFANGFIEYGTFRPYYMARFTTAATNPTLPTDAYFAASNGTTQYDQRRGYYVRIGHFVFVWFSISTFSTRNGLANFAPSSWTTLNSSTGQPNTALVIAGMPYGYSHTNYSTSSSLNQFVMFSGGITVSNLRNVTGSQYRTIAKLYIEPSQPTGTWLHVLDTVLNSPNTTSQVQGYTFTHAGALTFNDASLQIRDTYVNGWAAFTTQDLNTFG